jgi:PAS domain S-box-containing protein
MPEEGHRLLVVDDQADQVEIIEFALQTKSPAPKITVAKNGRACLEALSKEHFSAVLLDYSLPEMSGLEVLEAIKHEKYDVPVIVVTARGDEAVAVEAMKKGAADYIVKKTGYEELLQTVVERAIEQHTLKTRLAQSEERYKKLVECASDVVCLLDLDGKIVMINHRIEQLTGHASASLIGRPLNRLIFPEDHVLFHKALKEVCDGLDISSEFRMRCKDDITRWVSVSGGALSERGKVSGAIFIFRDVSRQKEAEAALVRRNNDLRLLLEVGNTLVSHHDLDQILEIFARHLARAIVVTFTRIFLIEDGKVVARAAHPIREFEWEPGLGESFRIDALPRIEEILRGKRSVVMPPEILKEGYLDPEQKRFLVSNLTQIQSVAAVPLINKGEVLGIIILGERRRWERNPLSEGQIALCEAIGHQAAIAVENARLFHALKVANLDTIKALGGALETKDLATKGHSDRTVALALSVARRLGLSEQEREWTQYSAILHDIGKIGIPESILNKPAKLTGEEYEIMKRHPLLGCEIVSQIDFLKPIVPFVRADHERWDGRGYPDGLKGEEIPLIARIVAAVDAYDAMTSDRVYRKALEKAYAVRELERCAGTQFDPKVVEALLDLVGTDESDGPGSGPRGEE